MSYYEMDAQMYGSCLSYSKMERKIANEFGVPAQGPTWGSSRSEQLLDQVRAVVQEHSRRAAEEGVLRGLQLATEYLPKRGSDGLVVPPTEVQITEGGVGAIRTCPFNSKTRPWR